MVGGGLKLNGLNIDKLDCDAKSSGFSIFELSKLLLAFDFLSAFEPFSAFYPF